jgi:hypothetical protein
MDEFDKIIEKVAGLVANAVVQVINSDKFLREAPKDSWGISYIVKNDCILYNVQIDIQKMFNPYFQSEFHWFGDITSYTGLAINQTSLSKALISVGMILEIREGNKLNYKNYGFIRGTSLWLLRQDETDMTKLKHKILEKMYLKEEAIYWMEKLEVI